VYSRVTLLEFDPVRFDVATTLERFEELVLPELQARPGYEGALVLANDDAKGMVLTLWASREDADAGLATGFWAAQVERFVTLLAAPAGREGYEVVYAGTPALAPG
jgi:heme-degrading monooxygenase HmoA